MRPTPSAPAVSPVSPAPSASVLPRAPLGVRAALFAAACACASPMPSSPGSEVSSPMASTATFAHAQGAVAKAAMTYPQIATSEEAPFSLTTSDGAGLELTRIDAKAVVEGPLAYTELHLYFHNPEDRVREGRFTIALPDGAALSRFAMENNGQWMEAEVVEKMAARRAYEDFLHRRQDPALLEKAGGNEFTARVFPIPARGDKHLVISYSQEVTRDHYTLPLRGLPAVGKVDAVVRVAQGGAASARRWDESTLHQKAWKPDRDLVVAAPASMPAVIAGDLFAARVAVPAVSKPEPMTSVAILVDTSASRALGFTSQIAQVGEVVAAIAAAHGGGVDVHVAAFDQDVLPIYHGRADGFGADQRQALLARQPLGASDLGTALDWAGTTGARRVLLIGDGVVTAGAEGDALIAKLKSLAERKVERLDAVLVGGIRDLDGARTLAQGPLARAGVVLTIDRGAAEIARRLALAVAVDVPVKVEGAAWVWPERAAGIQPGDEIVVYGQRKARGGLAIDLAGQRVALDASVVERPLVSRALAQAEVARLERALARAEEPKAKADLRKQITETSVRNRVLSSQTAFLVLESEQDYVRYGIPRDALADILEVGADGGVRTVHRGAPVLIVDPAPRPQLRPDDGDLKAKKRVVDTGAPADGVDDGKRDEEKDAEGGDELVSADKVSAVETAAPPPPPAAAPRPPRPASAAPAAQREARPEPVVRPAGGESAGSAAGRVTLSQEREDDSDRASARDSSGSERRRLQVAGDGAADEEPAPTGPPALTGKLAAIDAKLKAGKLDDALVQALAWRREEPGDVLALLGLGEALEARRDLAMAARAYGSIIDLYASRADLRRFAGERLERLAAAGRQLAIDTYRHAVADRPDHLTGHRLLAMALVRAGKHQEAFAALVHGLAQDYPSDRFRGGTRILREDLGLVAAAWRKAAPARAAEIDKLLAASGATLATKPSLRFVLYWETDANDVDFHIRDGKRGHAYYSSKDLPSGGSLYEDVTTGYGPECFTIDDEPRAYPYQLQIHYYSRGPMGYGMGVLEVVRHDGKGGLTFEHRPYVAMSDQAYVDLGSIGPRTATAAIAR